MTKVIFVLYKPETDCIEVNLDDQSIPHHLAMFEFQFSLLVTAAVLCALVNANWKSGSANEFIVDFFLLNNYLINTYWDYTLAL